ncbi:MAG: bifunctional phosphoribosylaminoimidazolecarboxamide formyltransferase/IMP cyclohydrolase [Pseudomonadales bacterium]|nr:bifunctional phosphoribosylaminoimidazolecarboxamide formyltransferase/IMP cyclohydrolase [Pseudomonadales bacterium]
MTVKRALLSVSDKSGIVELAKLLSDNNVSLLSTGGTYAVIHAAGIPVTEVSDHTGFPEMMDGRVKTLHPHIHGGILGRRDQDEVVMREHTIAPIDMVVVNLYPFEATVSKADCTLEQAIENIDIGGPAMLRSAAKNHQDVLVVVDPADYAAVMAEVDTSEKAIITDLALRFRFALRAFQHTAAYDSAVSRYLGGSLDDEFPDHLSLAYDKVQSLRYGENPHQNAAFYKERQATEGNTISGAQQLQGKALSFNNIADTDSALECVKSFAEPACVIVKHANPCGVAVAENMSDAYANAFATDPTSAFGGVIAFNQPIVAQTLKQVLDNQFVEVVVAPDFDQESVAVAKSKKNVRLLKVGDFGQRCRGLEFKRVGGGLLLQNADELVLDPEQLRTVTRVQPTDAQMADLLFAWKVAWYVKSNAIVYAKNLQTIGVGAGQMSRVVSAKIASMKAEEAGLDVPGSVMASDAFFPFRDGLDAAAEVGIAAVIQPGGSIRDDEVIAAADEHGLAMVFTGIRHFRH